MIVDLDQFRGERMTRTSGARDAAIGIAVAPTDIPIVSEIIQATANACGPSRRRAAQVRPRGDRAHRHPVGRRAAGLSARASDLAVDAMSNARSRCSRWMCGAHSRPHRGGRTRLDPGARRRATTGAGVGSQWRGRRRDASPDGRILRASRCRVARRGRPHRGAPDAAGVLRASKHDGTARARRFANTALRHAEPLAAELEGFAPELVANYRQWAGFAESWLIGAGGSRERSLQLLDWSLAHRERTARADATVGMLLGEIVLLHGYRDAAIDIFRTTRQRFAGVLPRHEISSARMLALRGLAA